MAAITMKEYEKRTTDWWTGKIVVALVDLSNGWFTAPAGSEFTITGKFGGFDLRLAGPCKCCGLRGHMSRVPPYKLELVSLSDPDPDPICSDCPPPDYPTDDTRCGPCPRRAMEKMP